MSPAESLALFAALVATTWLIVKAAIHTAMRDAQKVIDDARDMTDRAHAWAEIREDFADDEFELLRDVDEQMAGVEAKVLREWQNMPYDHEIWGL